MLQSQELPEAEAFAHRLKTEGADQTRALGQAVARLLHGGEIILLYGPLGAGKTCFSQGLCTELGVTDEVVSPTFTLVNTYNCQRLVVHHLDFYRVEPEHDLDDIGVPDLLDDVFNGSALTLVEWPEPFLRVLEPGDQRVELLVLPGDFPDERWWHLRGVPETPGPWVELFENFSANQE